MREHDRLADNWGSISGRRKPYAVRHVFSGMEESRLISSKVTRRDRALRSSGIVFCPLATSHESDETATNAENSSFQWPGVASHPVMQHLSRENGFAWWMYSGLRRGISSPELTTYLYQRFFLARTDNVWLTWYALIVTRFYTLGFSFSINRLLVTCSMYSMIHRRNVCLWMSKTCKFSQLHFSLMNKKIQSTRSMQRRTKYLKHALYVTRVQEFSYLDHDCVFSKIWIHSCIYSFFIQFRQVCSLLK